MLKNKSANIISIGAFCSTLSVLFQLAPMYLPGLGLAISPLSSLPIIAAAWYSLFCGSLTYLCTGLIILLLSPHESVVFMLTTGIFGLMLGLTNSKKTIISVTLSGLSLFSGINILTYLIGIAALGDAIIQFPVFVVLFITLLFSFAYSCFWVVIIKMIRHRFRSFTKN